MSQLILARNGRPFSDQDAASFKAKTMSEETGIAFRVVTHQDGWAIASAGAGASSSASEVSPSTADRRQDAQPELDDDALRYQVEPPPWEGRDTPRARSHPQDRDDGYRRQPGHPNSNRSESAYEEEEGMTFRPSPRAFLHYFLMAIIGVLSMVFAAPIVGYARTELGMEFSTEDIAYLISIMTVTGLLVAVYFLSAFLWIYLSHIYRVKSDLIVQQVGVIARKTSEVHPSDVKNISVDQTSWQRILMVGDVHFATAGTADYDLVMKNIAGPAKVRDQIYALVRSEMGDRRRRD